MTTLTSKYTPKNNLWSKIIKLNNLTAKTNIDETKRNFYRRLRDKLICKYSFLYLEIPKSEMNIYRHDDDQCLYEDLQF